MKTKKYLKILFIFFFFSLLLIKCSSDFSNKKKIISNSKKKKKSKNFKKNKLNQFPPADKIRPSDISPELFCDICQAIIIEADKNLRNLSKESDIIFYMDDSVCSREKYKEYHFSMQEMEISCEIFLGYYSDELVKELMERKKFETEEGLIQDFCYKKTKACNEGIDLTNIKPIENAFVDGDVYDVEYVEEKRQVYPTIDKVNYQFDENTSLDDDI